MIAFKYRYCAWGDHQIKRVQFTQLKPTQGTNQDSLPHFQCIHILLLAVGIIHQCSLPSIKLLRSINKQVHSSRIRLCKLHDSDPTTKGTLEFHTFFPCNLNLLCTYFFWLNRYPNLMPMMDINLLAIWICQCNRNHLQDPSLDLGRTSSHTRSQSNIRMKVRSTSWIHGTNSLAYNHFAGRLSYHHLMVSRLLLPNHWSLRWFCLIDSHSLGIEHSLLHHRRMNTSMQGQATFLHRSQSCNGLCWSMHMLTNHSTGMSSHMAPLIDNMEAKYNLQNYAETSQNLALHSNPLLLLFYH